MKEVMKELNEELKKLVGKKYVLLVDRGNTAIKIALQVCRDDWADKVIVPDQGGWITYLQYPKKLGFEMEKLKTDAGLINTDDLVGLKGCLLILIWLVILLSNLLMRFILSLTGK